MDPVAQLRGGDDLLGGRRLSRCTPRPRPPWRGRSPARRRSSRRSLGPPPGRRRPRGSPSSHRGRRRRRCRPRRGWSPASRRRPRSIVPHLEVFSRGSESLMIGLAALPSAMITRSAVIVSVLPGGAGPPAAGLVGLAELHHVERRRRDEAVSSSPRNSDGDRSTGRRDALLERVVQLLDAGGHLRLGAPVDDRDVAAEPARGTRRVHRGVATADDQHLLALGVRQRRLVVLAQALHEVDPGEELVGRHHVEQVLTGDVHETRQAGARPDEDPPEPGVLAGPAGWRSCRPRSSARTARRAA